MNDIDTTHHSYDAHLTSLAWLEQGVRVLDDLGEDGTLTQSHIAQFWAAVAQEAACMALVFVRRVAPHPTQQEVTNVDA